MYFYSVLDPIISAYTTLPIKSLFSYAQKEEKKTQSVLVPNQCKDGLCAVLCLVAQLCPTLCDPMDYKPPGSSVNAILQARILEWVAMPSYRGSLQPRDWTQVSNIVGGFFTSWVTRETQEYWSG